MSGAWPYLAAILPTILVATFFYFIVKSILEGDRRERLAQRQYEQEQDARRAAREHDAARSDEVEKGPGNGSEELHGN